MSRLDELEKAVVTLAKQAGLAYDLKGTGLEADPLGDYDGDGIPNILDSHPTSALQRGRSRPKATANRLPAEYNAPIGLNPAAGSGAGASGGPFAALSNSELTNTLISLILLQLINNLQGTVAQQPADVTHAPVGRPTQDFLDLQGDYVSLYDLFDQTYFVDSNGSVIDGNRIISKLGIMDSTTAGNSIYMSGKDYDALVTDYRKLWDAYHTHVGQPPHFAEQR